MSGPQSGTTAKTTYISNKLPPNSLICAPDQDMPMRIPEKTLDDSQMRSIFYLDM